MAAETVTVCSKLPFSLWAEVKGQRAFLINGAKAEDAFGEAFLLPGYGMTPNVDKAAYDAWVNEVGEDYKPLETGAIFATTPAKALDESNEMAGDVTSGFEQKTEKELAAMGVTVAQD